MVEKVILYMSFMIVFLIGIWLPSVDPSPPVLLIPGNGGNQLEARLGENWANKKGCPNPGTWFRLWLDVLQLLSAGKVAT